MNTPGFKEAFQSCHASHVTSQRAASYSMSCLLKPEHRGMAMSVSTAKPLPYLVVGQKRISGCSGSVYGKYSFLVVYDVSQYYFYLESIKLSLLEMQKCELDFFSFFKTLQFRAFCCRISFWDSVRIATLSLDLKSYLACWHLEYCFTKDYCRQKKERGKKYSWCALSTRCTAMHSVIKWPIHG